MAGVAPGDTLLFYTDGVTDLPGADERFGEQRLLEAAAAGPNRAADLIARIERRLDEFQASDRSDDRAMLALEWVGAAKPPRLLCPIEVIQLLARVTVPQ